MTLSVRGIYVLESRNRAKKWNGEFEQVREMESASSGVVTFRYRTVETRNEQIDRE
jgi:hypothetical protein